MSKKWTAIILSILAVALIVGLIFVKDMDFSKEDKEADTDTKKVESIAVLNMGNTIKEVGIINQGNHYVFVKDGDKWKLTIPADMKHLQNWVMLKNW